jgi:putative SOS response-associated peptidase YedK
MRWGLIPMGRTNARGRPVLGTLVHARSETLFSKSAYASLRRCAVPVSGWYEWTGPPRRKTRWTLAAADGGLLLIAAVWDLWRAPGGQEVASLATVTCAPSPEVAAVHDRMPAILDAAGLPVWLGEAPGELAPLLAPVGRGRLRVEPDR